MSQELKYALQALHDRLSQAVMLGESAKYAYTPELQAMVGAALARTHQPEADPIAEGIRAVSASARKSADDGAWKKLFWEVARLLNCLPSSFVDSNDHVLKKARELTVAQQPAQVVPEGLTVRLTSFPESNGKRNWTAMFVRKTPWKGLVGNAGGITIDRGECWNRVAYAAERARCLLGERQSEPDILAYGKDVPTPEDWQGTDPDGAFAASQHGERAE